MKKIYIVFDIIGPNGYIPYVYDKNNLSDIMEWELKNIHDTIYFEDIPKKSSYEIVNKLEYDSECTYLIPIDWSFKETAIDDILTPDFFSFINSKENFFIIYVNNDYEHPVYPLL